MTAEVPLLVISGTMGAGKTTVLSEASDLLAQAGVPHAAIDLDWLSVMHPSNGPRGDELMFANLAAVWPIYKRAGASRLMVASVVENRSGLARYRTAVPGSDPVVCRLEAAASDVERRLRAREPGMFQEGAIARSTALTNLLARTGAEDFKVDNDEGRHITDVAREVLARAGWLEGKVDLVDEG